MKVRQTSIFELRLLRLSIIVNPETGCEVYTIKLLTFFLRMKFCMIEIDTRDHFFELYFYIDMTTPLSDGDTTLYSLHITLCERI